MSRGPGPSVVGEGQPVELLTGDRSDEIEILVDVENRKTRKLSYRGDQEIGDRWCPVLASLRQHAQHEKRSFFDRWR